MGQPNTRAKVVKKLLCGRTPGMHEFCPEYLTFLHVWCVSWVTHLCNIMQQSGTVPLDWQISMVVPLFNKEDRSVRSRHMGSKLFSLPGKLTKRAEFDCWLNLEKTFRP